jgi:hypothetical protein
MTLLTLLLSVASPPPPGASSAVAAVPDLARLTPAQAWALDGRRAMFLVELDSAPEEWRGLVLYDCLSPDAVLRSLRLCPGQDVVDDMVVEATLRVVVHEPSGPFVGFVEYRLAGARRR